MMQLFGSRVCIKWEANREIRRIFIRSNAFGDHNWKTTRGRIGGADGGQLSGLGLEI